MNEGTNASPSYFSRSVKTASSSGCCLKTAISHCSLWGFHSSSESRNETSSPVASFTPALRVADTLGVRAHDVLQARISDGLETIRRIVRRSIVDDEDVEIIVRLGERASDGARNDVAAVVGRDDDGGVHAFFCCRTDTTRCAPRRRCGRCNE